MELSKNQIKAASDVEIVKYCKANGILLVHDSGDTWQHKDYDSLKITGNMWIRHSGKDNGHGFTKGNTIHFLQEYEGFEFREAVFQLLEFINSPLKDNRQSIRRRLDNFASIKTVKPHPIQSHVMNNNVAVGTNPNLLMNKMMQQPPIVPPAQGIPAEQIQEKRVEPPKAVKKTRKSAFKLPEKDADNKEIVAYLTQVCGIHIDIVMHMIKNGSLYQDTHKNCVFVGFDEKNEARYAGLVGTWLKPNGERFIGEAVGSNKMVGWGCRPRHPSETLFVFENTIEMLSSMSLKKLCNLEWLDGCYLALGGLADAVLYKYLKDHIEIKNIVFCLSNDIPGRAKTEEFVEKYSAKYNCSEMPPHLGSFSEDLILRRQEGTG